MKTKVKVAYSVTHQTTVTVTLNEGDFTVVRAAKCSSTKIKETITELVGKAMLVLTEIKDAM